MRLIQWSLLAMAVSACQPGQAPEPPARPEKAAGQLSLPWSGDGFALLATDANGDGRQDLMAISHADNDLHLFQQAADNATFTLQPVLTGVGFHPGNVLTWSTSPPTWVEAAEGDGKIRAWTWDNAQGTLREISALQELAPRYASRFEWPGWGPSLAVSPYVNGYVALLKGYDPATGQAASREIALLSNQPNTIRAAERITVADLEGDGVPELVFAVSATNEVMVIRYPGSPDFGPVRPLRAEVLYADDKHWGMPNEVQVHDLDRDGVPELIVPDEARPSKIHVLARQPEGHYREVDTWSFPGPEGVMELRMMTDRDGQRYAVGAGPGAVAIFQFPAEWSFGQPLPVRQIAWRRNSDFPQDMLITDLNGDGWQDLVLSRSNSQYNLWLAYGSLWDRFKALADVGFGLE